MRVLTGRLVFAVGTPTEKTFATRGEAVAYLRDYPRTGPFTLREDGPDAWILTLDRPGYEPVPVRWVLDEPTALAGTSPLVVVQPVVSPDCRVGKCRACSGDGGWDDEADALAPCSHDCHGGRS